MPENENKIERRVNPLDGVEMRVVRGDDGKPTSIEGYAAVFNKESVRMDWFVETIAPGAFKNCLAKSDVRCLFNHDSNQLPLGRTKSGTLELREDKKGLWFRCALPDAQHARDLAALIERGDIDGCSFAFTTKAEEWEYSKDDKPDQRILTEVDTLFDVGPVVYPAYPDTSVSARDVEVARRSWEAGKPQPEKREDGAPATGAPVDDKPLLNAAKARMEEYKAKRLAEAQKRLNERIKRQKEADASA
jgi:uncharacterized protein